VTTGPEEGGQLAIPHSETPIDIGGGGIVGPAVVPRHRQIRLIRPRKWRRIEASRVHGIWFLECPYCLTIVADEGAADEHLFRLHANNSREHAGQFDLIPWLTELQRQVDHLEEDLVEPDTWRTGTDQRQVAGTFDRKRRRVHWRQR